jgi:hypothetical protein
MRRAGSRLELISATLTGAGSRIREKDCPGIFSADSDRDAA